MFTDTSQARSLKQSFVALTKLAWMWTSQMQCVNWNQGRSCITDDCWCLFANDFWSRTFETSEPHSYSVLPLSHISESDSKIFCFLRVTGFGCVSPPLRGRKMVVKGSLVTWGKAHWGLGTHTLTPSYVNPDMLLLILIRQIKLARRLR